MIDEGCLDKLDWSYKMIEDELINVYIALFVNVELYGENASLELVEHFAHQGLFYWSNKPLDQ
ncbi:hypothetical protein HPP92_007252, partial [Vanilla planifolia]